MKTADSRLWTPDYSRVFLANLLLLMAGNGMGSMSNLRQKLFLIIFQVRKNEDS